MAARRVKVAVKSLMACFGGLCSYFVGKIIHLLFVLLLNSDSSKCPGKNRKAPNLPWCAMCLFMKSEGMANTANTRQVGPGSNKYFETMFRSRTDRPAFNDNIEHK